MSVWYRRQSKTKVVWRASTKTIQCNTKTKLQFIQRPLFKQPSNSSNSIFQTHFCPDWFISIKRNYYPNMTVTVFEYIQWSCAQCKSTIIHISIYFRPIVFTENEVTLYPDTTDILCLITPNGEYSYSYHCQKEQFPDNMKLTNRMYNAHLFTITLCCITGLFQHILNKMFFSHAI